MDGLLRAFDAWMNGSGLSSLLLWSVLLSGLWPVLVLAHELGHAAVGLLRTEGLVAIRVGRAPGWTGRIGRLAFSLNLVPARRDSQGLAQVFGRIGRIDAVALVLAGPLAQAVAALVVVGTVGAFMQTSDGVLAAAAAIGVADAAFNLVPRERHGRRSDGRFLLDALRRPIRRNALDDTWSRWVAVVSDRRAWQNERRMRLFGGAPVALGHPADQIDERSKALWWLAASGWCWREAERGDPDRIRDAVLDAIHTATVTGAVEPNLTALAARALATDGVELGLASPGGDDDERIGFLAGAFHRLPKPPDELGLDPSHRWFAFRYGVALRDVERLRG